MTSSLEAAQQLRMLAIGRVTSENSAATELLEVLAAAAERFSSAPVAELSAKISALKPAQRRKSQSTSIPSQAPSVSVDALVAELRDTLEDQKLSLELIDRFERNAAIKVPEARAIAKAIGAGTNSKSSRKAVFDALRALAKKAERDRYQAERIRKGA